MLIRTQRGVVHIERVFLRRKRAGEVRRSARMPVVKVRRARVRPMMVRYWKCQP